MQREEKQLDATLEAVNLRVSDLKTSIGSMIYKLEHEYETINWPTFLDNFALISGHVSNTMPLGLFVTNGEGFLLCSLHYRIVLLVSCNCVISLLECGVDWVSVCWLAETLCTVNPMA
jgi:hypothetical protein